MHIKKNFQFEKFFEVKWNPRAAQRVVRGMQLTLSNRKRRHMKADVGGLMKRQRLKILLFDLSHLWHLSNPLHFLMRLLDLPTIFLTSPGGSWGLLSQYKSFGSAIFFRFFLSGNTKYIVQGQTKILGDVLIGNFFCWPFLISLFFSSNCLCILLQPPKQPRSPMFLLIDRKKISRRTRKKKRKMSKKRLSLEVGRERIH